MRTGIIIALAVGLLFCIVVVFEKKATAKTDYLKNQAPAAVITSQAPKKIDTAQLRLDSIQRIKEALELKTLEKKFIKKSDEFRDVAFYQHKQWYSKYWLNRKVLYAYLNSDGGLFLVSNYYGDDWIFHTNCIVMVGDEKFYTYEVPSYDPNNKTDNEGGSVWENVTYTGDEALKIIRAIAENNDKPVKVRMQGKDWRKDITMSAADKKAFAEIWRFYQLR